MEDVSDKKIKIANKEFSSRLIIGTGKFKNYELNKSALEASKAEIVTVAIRRVNLTDKKLPKLTDFISPKKNILFYLTLLVALMQVKPLEP